MHILGDIGNSETKLFLVSKNKKILRKITFPSKKINHSKLNYLFKKIKYNSIILKKFYFVVLFQILLK